MKKKLICFKIGGSVITNKDKPYTAKKKAIRDIALALKQIKTPFIISHGSGSFGHTSAAKYYTNPGYTTKWGIAKVSYDARKINEIVTRVFLDEGLPVVSLSPMSFISSEKGQTRIFIYPLLTILRQGLIPIVYGDVIWDAELKSVIFSGESILGKLCGSLKEEYKIEKIIELCNVGGVLDKKGKVIPEINSHSWETIQELVNASGNTDVTGGMRHKIEEALQMAKNGISTNILNGTNSQALLDSICDKKVGTLISL